MPAFSFTLLFKYIKETYNKRDVNLPLWRSVYISIDNSTKAMWPTLY